MRAHTVVTMLAILTMGCSVTTSSGNVRTRGVVALIDVTSDREDRVVVATELVVGAPSSNTYLILDNGDRLSATVGSDTRGMVAVGEGDYEARFAADQGEVVVSFEREGDDDAPASRGILGPWFAIKNRHGQMPVSRKTEEVILSWAPVDPEAEVRVALSGECVIRERKRLGGDTGFFSLDRGELRAWKKHKKDTCAVDVEVIRTRRGEPDPALDRDSRFLLHRIQRTRFISAP